MFLYACTITFIKKVFFNCDVIPTQNESFEWAEATPNWLTTIEFIDSKYIEYILLSMTFTKQVL